MKYSVWNQDAILGMQEHCDDNSVDLVFTDPPYGIDGDSLDAHYHRKESTVVQGYVDVPKKQYAQFTQKWITEVDRVLRPGGSCYIVSGYTNLHHILNALHTTDLEEINHIIAHYTFGVYTTRKWVSSHYHVLFWAKPETKSQRRTFNTYARYDNTRDSYNDRLTVQQMQRDYKPGQIKNRNQLPESFIEKFITYSSQQGDLVLDPFCGGFTTGRTALRLQRRFWGFEINTTAYNQFAPTLECKED